MDVRAVDFLLPRVESLVTSMLLFRERRNLLHAPLAHFTKHIPFFPDAVRSLVLSYQLEPPLRLSCSEALKALRPHTTVDRSHVIESFLSFVNEARDKIQSLGTSTYGSANLPAVQYLEGAVAFWRSRCVACQLDSSGTEGDPLPMRVPMDAVVSIFAAACQSVSTGLPGMIPAADVVLLILSELDTAVSTLERREEHVMRSKFFGATFATGNVVAKIEAENAPRSDGTSPSRQMAGFYRRQGRGKTLVKSTRGYILRAQAQLVASMQTAVHESIQHETAVSDATVRSMSFGMTPHSASAHREDEGQLHATNFSAASPSPHQAEGQGRPQSASSSTGFRQRHGANAALETVAAAAQADSRPSTPLHGSVRVRPVSAGAGNPRPSEAAERRRKWALKRKETVDAVAATLQKECVRVMRATERVAKVAVTPGTHHGAGDSLLKACADAQVEALRTFRNAQLRMERARGSALQSIRALTKQWQATAERSYEPAPLVTAPRSDVTSAMVASGGTASPSPVRCRPSSAMFVASRVHGRTLPPEVSEERLAAFVAESTGSRYPGGAPAGVNDYSAEVRDQRMRNVRKLIDAIREDHRLVRVRLSPWRVSKDPETDLLCPQKYSSRGCAASDSSVLSRLREWNAAQGTAADPTLLGERSPSVVRYYFVDGTSPTEPHQRVSETPNRRQPAHCVSSGAFADLTRLIH